MKHNDMMKLAIEEAQKTMKDNIGGPFGAVITDLDGNLIAVASNTVLGDHDPTAHAEINAIRKACQILGTHNLQDCILYATGYPCPMCLSAIIWANIKQVYFGCRPEDAEAIGFRDDYIYRFINENRTDSQIVALQEVSREECIKLFQEYTLENKKLY